MSKQLTLDELTDDNFMALAAGLLRLRSLRIRGQDWGLTARVLRGLGRHCCLLEELDFGSTWDMSSWQEKEEREGRGDGGCSYYSDSRDGSSGGTQETGPLFPWLKSLRLDDMHVAEVSDHDR